MFFVGRARETHLIIKSLERGENVIISGRFGMGRTSLVRHIADISRDTWRFVFIDFSKTPGNACRHLVSELFPEYAAQQAGAYIKYKPGRFQILNREPEDKRRHVLVLDNIEKISKQKLTLLRHLAFEKRFLFIAITASFLPENDYRELRATLLATCRITLGHMTRASTEEFFRFFSSKYRLGWPDEHIASLSNRTQGYPLSMKEIVHKVQRVRQIL